MKGKTIMMNTKMSFLKIAWWLKIFVANIFCEKIEILRIRGPQYIKVFAHDNFISFDVRKDSTAPRKIFKKAQEHILEDYLISKIPPIYHSISIRENKDSYSIDLSCDDESLEKSKYFFNILSLCDALEKYLCFVFKYAIHRPFMDDWDWKYMPDDVYGIAHPPISCMPSILDGNKIHFFFEKYKSNLLCDENDPFYNDKNFILEQEKENLYQLNELLFDTLPKVYSTFKIIPFETHYEIVVTLSKL